MPATITEWLLQRRPNFEHRTVACSECEDLTQDSTGFCSVECATRAYERAITNA